MKAIELILIFVFGIIIGAVFHEADLSRNFQEFGNAKAWFFEIKE